jgi:hypothetical protein
MSTYDFNYGAMNPNTPSPFSVPTGMGVAPNSFNYGPLDTAGMGGSPTLGANAGNLALPGGATPPGGMAGIGMNLPTAQLGLSGISTLANLYTGLQALSMAKQQFGFQKDMAQKNYTNSVSNYNTSLEDRANARASVTGQSAADTAAYIAAHKLA